MKIGVLGRPYEAPRKLDEVGHDKNKNRGNLCQHLKNYILTYQVISNKFTIVRLCTVQRYYKPCGTRHRFPNSIKHPGRFMECIKKTGNKQLSTLEPMKVLV
jgi:hypothetical protein